MTASAPYTRLELKLALTVVSPFLFRGLPGKLFGLDASALRDEQGRPIIPADQVRGCLRDAFEDLAAAGTGLTADGILELFGRQSAGEGDAGTQNEPSRSRLSVSDLTAMAVDRSRLLETTRIEIDNDTGAVAEGMMQVIELVVPFGAKVEFVGHATVFVPAGSEKTWETRFAQAMNLITAIGAVKSAGYGEVLHGSATRVTAARVTVPTCVAGAPVRRRYRVTFDRPILVDADWIAGNAMAGSAVIPGAVFKGALAQALSYAGEDPAHGRYRDSLAEFTFTHAFPESDVSGKSSLTPFPLSLVAVEKDENNGLPDRSNKKVLVLGDALLCAEGKGVMLADKPALFSGDWKPSWFEHAITELKYPYADEPPLLARTHTAITHDGVARDQDLYTTLARSVRRKDKQGAWLDRGWILDIDCSGAALALNLLALLEKGLDGIGKTGARACFESLDEPPNNEPQEIHGRSGEYAVMLLTAAHILDAPQLVLQTGGIPNWRVSAREAYEAYWNTVLPGAKLENFFASQKYTGGYLARRRRAFGKDCYHPFLLTEAGSIFRLSQIRGDTLDRLKNLCRSGLPPSTVNGLVATWENCPYVPENGYGRITADHLSGQIGSMLLREVTYE